MKILLVVATKLEIEPLFRNFDINNNGFHINDKHSVSLLYTGVGMTATAFAMGRMLALQKYDLAINCGIAGAFDRSLLLGEVVAVKSDCFSELGAEDGMDFIPIDLLGLGKSGSKPETGDNFIVTNSLKKVRAITVNKVHGNDESIFETVQRLNPQIETMEGAAFFYACNEFKIPCIQIRGISNYIERRDRERWNIPLAVKSLNQALIEILNNLP